MRKTNDIGILCLMALLHSNLVVYPASITGRVVDGRTRRPLPGANIELMRTGLGSAVDDAGVFIIENVAPGEYTLKATHIGFKPVEKEVTVAFYEDLNIDIYLEPVSIKGESIVVIGRGDANHAVLHESPVGFTRLTRTDLADQYTTDDVPDLFQDVPGVWTSTAGLGESEMTIRGFTSDRIRVMINNIPMNDPEDQRVVWSDWAGLAGMIGSVEIHRGPGFSLYGSNAFGGSIHITTMGVDPRPVKRFRFSVGLFQRMGIRDGVNSGKVFDPDQGAYVNAGSPLQYTYSASFNSGPKFGGRLNIRYFFEYKAGDSYLLGTRYDGYTLGLEVESKLGNHRLQSNFTVSPQFHRQAFPLQDLDLLGRLGREYNRKSHEWQENRYTQPFWSLRHEWRLSDNHTLYNHFFLSIGRGADQSLMNDAFDVETGTIAFQPCTRGGDAQAFGKHAQYLYDNYGLLTTDFIPRAYGSGSWFKGVEVANEFGICENFFVDQHTHSYQNRRRRDHVQFGAVSFLDHRLNAKIHLEYGFETRFWWGRRVSECWYLQISNLEAADRQIWAPLNIHNYTGKVQSIFDYGSRVHHLASFGRMTWRPAENLTVQSGTQLVYSRSKVIENPIPLLDFGTWDNFDTSKRTTADLAGDRLYGWCNDYVRTYLYLSPWIGVNLRLAPDFSVFTRASNARKQPSILDWYDTIRGPLFQRAYYPDLEEAVSIIPESVNSVELGFTHRLRAFTIQASAYHTLYRNKIETVVDINDRRTSMNAGKASFQGIECEVYGRWHRFDVTGTAALARNRWLKMNVKEVFGSDAAEVVGKVVPFSPERMFSASLGYTDRLMSNPFRISVGLRYWDSYYGTYTNRYARIEKIVASDGLTYDVEIEREARLPAYLDLHAQLRYAMTLKTLGIVFRVDAGNLLNRSDNYLRAQYSVDYTRNDDLAGKYHWYVLPAPLFNIFFTAEVTIN